MFIELFRFTLFEEFLIYSCTCINVGVGIGTGFLFLYLLGYKLHQCIKQKQERVRKKKLLRQNGGLLLQEKMSRYGNREKVELFRQRSWREQQITATIVGFLVRLGMAPFIKGCCQMVPSLRLRSREILCETRLRHSLTKWLFYPKLTTGTSLTPGVLPGDRVPIASV